MEVHTLPTFYNIGSQVYIADALPTDHALSPRTACLLCVTQTETVFKGCAFFLDRKAAALSR